MNRSLVGVLSVFGLVFGPACHASHDEPLEPAKSPQDGVQDGPAAVVGADSDPDSEALPADLATINALLRARHVDDLPSAAQLAEYPSAEASLREIAADGGTMLVRTRALSLLRHFNSAPTGELLMSILVDPDNQVVSRAALRAAAVTGLGGQPLDQQPERLERVVAALGDSDPRVGVAAVKVLGQFEAGRNTLKTTGDVSKPVRDAIQALK